MNDGEKLTMELDTVDTETVQSMIGVVLEHGDAIQKRAAVAFGNKIGQVMLEQIPGMREIAGEMVEELRNEGMPEEIADELIKSIEPPPVSEEEVEGVDVDELLNQIRTEEEE